MSLIYPVINKINMTKQGRSPPASPKKRELTRKGSAERISRKSRGGSSGNSKGSDCDSSGSGKTRTDLRSSDGRGTRSKRNLRRSQTAPGTGGRGGGVSSGSRSRIEQQKIDAFKSRSSRAGDRSAPGSAAKRIREKNVKSDRGSSSSKYYRAGGGGGKGNGDTCEDSEKKRKQDSKRSTSSLNKCLQKICRIGLTGQMEVESEQARQAVKRLKLTSSDIVRLRASFNEIDIDESGEIDYDEFMESMEEHRNAFTDAVFRLIDINGDGLLEFDEFVAICGSFCMWSQNEILQFCFQTFDSDGGGTIDEEEFEALAKTISHKDPTFPGNFARALEEFDADGDGLIDFDEFVTMNRRYPMVLFPMFRLQDKMQKQTLGLKRWNQVMKLQNKLNKVRQWRLTHGGEMPPEGCWAMLKRCGEPRVGADEDMADLEKEMIMLKKSVEEEKNKKAGGRMSAMSGSKVAW